MIFLRRFSSFSRNQKKKLYRSTKKSMDTDEFDILSAALSESGLDATMPSSSGLSSPAPVTGDACLPTASRITDRISPVRASNYSVPSTPVLKPLPAVRPQSVGRTVRVITVRKDAKGRLIVPRLNAPTSGLQPISSVPARLDNAHLLPTSSYSRAGAAGVESIQMNRSAGPSSPHSGSGAHFFSSPVGTTREHSLSPSASSFDSETSEVQTPNPCGGGSSFLHNTTSTPTSSSRYSSRQPPDIHFRTPTTSVFNSPVSHHPLHHVAQSPFHKSASTPVFPQHGTELMPADDVNDDDDDIGYSDTYSEYKPAKLQIGVRHPDPVVETSSLSAVVPPDITYRASIPEDVIDTGQLSALQLESIIYACQRHESLFPNKERAGYFVGDGAGVGKGRTLAGIIFENYLLGRRRALWFSVSSDLRLDAERDLSDIGANRIKVYPLNKFKYAKISSRENGAVKKGVVFSTYASLIGESHSAKGKYRSRIKQICHWCGGSSFDGVIIFDECHRAKNLLAPGGGKPSKTGHAVVELQKLLPKARVVYASATGATEPRHMAYMTRLGLWGPGMAFPTFQDFITAVEKRGVGAMEVVAMDMKLRGLYLARQLSFHGVSFRIEEVQLTEEFSRVFDEATKLWLDARQKFQLAADIIGAEGPSLKVMWAQFWSSHQRFFKYMCIAAKVDACVKLAKTALQNDKCVIIGLQSTGEARTLQHLAGEKNQLSGFVSTARRVFEALVTNHFPIVDSHSALRKCGLGRLYRGSAAKVKEEDEDCPFDHWLSGRPPSQGSAHESSESNNEENSSNNDSSSSGADSTTSEEEEVIDDTEQADGFNPFDNDDPDSWNVQREDLTEKSIGSSKSSVAKRALKDMGRKQKAANATAAKRPRFDISPDRSETIVNDPESLVNQGTAMRADLMNQIARLGPSLPPNTLDSLIDRLGGIENVAELTGRKGRIVSSRDGQVHYELRNENDVALEMLNVAEKERFMNGEKLIAIISEAASSGISLQADRRVANQKRRVHITLELPWSADKAIQQFGRSHRSNQVSAPEYVFLISSLAGEKRFASTVAKRLESLGALTHGDRRATESRDLSHFNIDTKYGRLALESVMRSILGSIVPLVAPPATYGGNFMHDMQSYLSGIGLLQMDTETGLVQLDKDSLSMTKFLNRLLGLPIKQQNSLFQFFADTLETVIAQARRDGRYDMGILDLGSGKEVVHKEESWTFICRGYGFGNFKTELHRVSVERGLSWDQAIEIYSDHQGSLDGFYTLNTNNSSKTQVAVLIVATGKRRLISGERLFNVYRPNTGLNTARFETETDLKRKYHKLKPRDAEELWIQQYDQSLTVCMHKYMHGRCRNETLGSPCEIGRRLRIYYLLSGSVLSIWPILDDVLACYSAATQLRTSLPRTQIVRLRTKDNKRIVGIWVPSGCVPMLRKRLSGGAPLPVIPEGFGANPIQPAGHL